MASMALFCTAWIKNFLTSRSQEVIIDNEYSHPCNVLSGVPQGTVLAPLLFLIILYNYLPLHVSNKVRLYADDVFYSNIHTVDDCHNLQKDLDSLSQWSYRWQMLFNPHKCEFLRITNKKKEKLYRFYLQYQWFPNQ